jgi:hypothetical protein
LAQPILQKIATLPLPSLGTISSSDCLFLPVLIGLEVIVSGNNQLIRLQWRFFFPWIIDLTAIRTGLVQSRSIETKEASGDFFPRNDWSGIDSNCNLIQLPVCRQRDADLRSSMIGLLFFVR